MIKRNLPVVYYRRVYRKKFAKGDLTDFSKSRSMFYTASGFLLILVLAGIVTMLNIEKNYYLLSVLLLIVPATIIAKLKSQEETPGDKNDQIVSAFDQMIEAVFISDMNGKIEIVNYAGCRLLDYEEVELIGRSLKEFLSDQQSANCLGFENSESAYKAECFLVKKDQTCFHAEIWKQSLSDGRIIQIVRDITGQKEELERIEDLLSEIKYERDLLEEQSAELVVLSNQLEQSEQVQKELNAEKDKFFSIIAHDLKSPFAGIMGYTALLLDEFDSLSKEEMRDFVSSLDKLSRNTFKLIENLLEWARLQTGKMKYNPTKIQLYESTLYAVSLVSANAERKEIRIINEIKDDPFVKADERMLNSVLENLLSNAIKFTPRGGSITISSSAVNIFYEVSIADTGVGMSPEVIEKIFRIDTNHTTLGTEQEKGTGLGVVLCKEMMERQGGALKVESKLGMGTKFSFILPIWEEEKKETITTNDVN
jgi:PAS domain S-box-containing protein